MCSLKIIQRSRTVNGQCVIGKNKKKKDLGSFTGCEKSYCTIRTHYSYLSLFLFFLFLSLCRLKRYFRCKYVKNARTFLLDKKTNIFYDPLPTAFDEK